jgi:hypothetical protein
LVKTRESRKFINFIGIEMNPYRKVIITLTKFLLMGSIVLAAAATGFRILVVSASGQTFSNTAFQVLAARPPIASSTSNPLRISTNSVTWAELVSFLEKDHTNWNPYIPGKYTCLDFSTDLVANATQHGFKAWIVAVDFTDGGLGHAFVAFETIDRGIVYVEPQADDTYPVVARGKNLCDSWGVYQCMGTVSSIQFIQCDKEHFCTKFTP